MVQQQNKFACLALSGGMDSTSLLIHLLARNYQVTAISFLYGQKHSIEIKYAKDIIQYLHANGYKINHQIITLDGLEKLLHSALVEDGEDVPEGHYAEENMRATVVPNRNKIFISILQSAALSIALKEKEKTVVAMGIQAGDHTIYPDCRQEFIDFDYQAYLSGNWDADQVTTYLPYINRDKYGILQDGLQSCATLNIDFDEVYKRTITSYKPNDEGISDYKSASSVARIEAFLKLNREDPIVYADESGIVGWDIVKAHVMKVLGK
ncbi:MAG: 7-cyano-7-deazaguanine synthase [Legionella sp.]|nr:7-cyano-7-deazaguanine synthase [Legionella sp.]